MNLGCIFLDFADKNLGRAHASLGLLTLRSLLFLAVGSFRPGDGG